jgi:cytochrome b561
MNRSIFTKYNIFLEWWWFFCSLILIFFVLGTVNLYELVWNADQTKISYGILVLFGAVSIFCGREAWKLSKLKRDNLDAEPSLKTKYETGWFASEICLTLGLIGTVSGFILMLYGAFSDLNISDPNSVQESLGKMSIGMSTALYTTLVGLICSVLLKLQFFRLEMHLDTYIKQRAIEYKARLMEQANESRSLQD